MCSDRRRKESQQGKIKGDPAGEISAPGGGPGAALHPRAGLGGLAKVCLTDEMASGRGAVDLLRWRVPRIEVLRALVLLGATEFPADLRCPLPPSRVAVAAASFVGFCTRLVRSASTDLLGRPRRGLFRI